MATGCAAATGSSSEPGTSTHPCPSSLAWWLLVSDPVRVELDVYGHPTGTVAVDLYESGAQPVQHADLSLAADPTHPVSAVPLYIRTGHSPKRLVIRLSGQPHGDVGPCAISPIG